MDEHTATVEEELSELGVIASYVWKPNRILAKRGGSYISVDMISDNGTAADVSDTVSEEGERQKAEIRALADSMKTRISSFEADYTELRRNLIDNYSQMYRYFLGQGHIALSTIMATAIVNLSLA